MSESIPQNKGPKPKPVDEKIIQLYREMARNPVDFFLASERRGKTLELNKVVPVLMQFRTRVSNGELQIPTSEVDPDLILFTKNANDTAQHYEGLFRIIRRLGFDIIDCETLLLTDFDLRESTGDFAELANTLRNVRLAIEQDIEMPPVHRIAREKDGNTKH